MSQRIPVVEKIFSANDKIAQENRQKLDSHKVFGLNFMASPGAGKTSLIEHTIRKLSGTHRVAVIDGDIATSIDADRASSAGAIAVQINTGGECHLDAIMVFNALEQINLDEIDLLIIENVGNLICPISFALGTHVNVLIASIPEGDDKPYKYPTMYRGVDALVINKIDLLPYIPFKMEYFTLGVQALNPGLITFPVSCKTEDGLEQWVDWITKYIEVYQHG